MTDTDTAGAAGADDIDLGVVLRALADEHRRAVVMELAADPDDGERACHSFHLPVSKQTRTYHFRTLVDSGLLREINYGNGKGVRLRRADVDHRLPGLLDLLAAEFTRSATSPARR
ncbi:MULTISPECIES: ArsR/SmtB family transcription factor [Streptomyces]|uniref:ArsR/SmtB family transcription factor n=1 Tax=Streptomyces TaxID=1883 RepID=UPI001CCC3A28|nr:MULTISPECIES: ArsR family transcriptional regulator [Streptomyces]MBZ6131447.1 ArsR family transcriptional regulator [Streptomyces olivaceus]MCU8589979.1 ArsR family transcriptional regulator [Streptomyces sp. A13(2022)]